MVTPVTGPFFESKTLDSVHVQFQKTRYRQKMPIDRPLPYRFFEVFGYDRLISSSASGSSDSGQVSNFGWSAYGNMSDFGRHYQHAYNGAYERLRGAASDSAGWGENLAQLRKSADMLSDRLVQLWRFTNHVRRGRFGEAASVLRIPKPVRVSNRKALASNYLEYSYGWAPLFSDVHSSIAVLTSDPGEHPIRGSASESWQDVYLNVGSDSQGSWSVRSVNFCNLKVTCRASVRVTNPNLFLASSLGLIDPALPWKLLPFSFVVDWFVNVEQVMGSMTTWLGAQLSNPHYTVFSRGGQDRQATTFYREWYPQLQAVGTSSTQSVRNQKAVEMVRTLGLPSPKLVLRPFQGFSISRGLQAVSLIVSTLGR